MVNTTDRFLPARFKSSDLVSIGIAQIRARVANCNLETLDYVANVTEEMGYGFYEDKSIDKENYKKSKNKIGELIEKFKKDCSCSKK